MSVDINLVKELRARTHAPLKDCKSVLAEANGDLDLAQELLRQKGVLKAAKKADRETNQGVVKFASNNGVISGIRVLCETDFVAKNEKFLALIDGLLSKIEAASGDFDMDSIDENLKNELTLLLDEQVGVIGEKLVLDYVYRSTKNGYVYNHNGNSISAVIFYNAEGSVDEIAKEVALQVAAMNPEYISMDDVPADRKDKLRAEFKEEMADSGKPADILDKIIEGKLNKTLQDDVLLEQPSIRDGAKKVKDIVGNKLVISDVLRVVVG